MDERERAAPPEQHPERLESRDVPAKPLVMVAIATVAGAVLTILLLHWLYASFQAAAREEDGARTLTAVPSAAPVPPEPRLQGVPGLHATTPADDLKELRESWTKQLESYGPTRDEGYVRIPVGRAMEILLERGLPEGR